MAKKNFTACVPYNILFILDFCPNKTWNYFLVSIHRFAEALNIKTLILRFRMMLVTCRQCINTTGKEIAYLFQSFYIFKNNQIKFSCQ